MLINFLLYPMDIKGSYYKASALAGKANNSAKASQKQYYN